MVRSHWFGGRVYHPVDDKQELHLLCSVDTPLSTFTDQLLAEKIGDLDPFVSATECGQDVCPACVQRDIQYPRLERKTG